MRVLLHFISFERRLRPPPRYFRVYCRGGGRVFRLSSRAFMCNNIPLE